MYPGITLSYLPEVCMVTPWASYFPGPRFSWKEIIFVSTAMDAREIGKQLKGAMQAATLLARPSVGANEYPEWDWEQQQYRRFETALHGSMIQRDKRWIIYCGNDCSPQVDFHLPARPPDNLAGEAFLRLHEELKSIRGTPLHPNSESV